MPDIMLPKLCAAPVPAAAVVVVLPCGRTEWVWPGRCAVCIYGMLSGEKGEVTIGMLVVMGCTCHEAKTAIGEAGSVPVRGPASKRPEIGYF